MYRVIVHLINAIESFLWIVFNYKRFKLSIVNNEYKTIGIYKFYLWSSDSKYFLIKGDDNISYFLKLYSPKLLEREVFILNTLSKEITTLTPKVCGFGSFSDYGYIILEYFASSSLNNIKNYNVDSDRLYKSLYQILLILRKHQIIHRDFRPHNILYGDKIVLIDFSSSIMKSHPIHSKELLDNEKTKALGDRYRWRLGWDDSHSIYKILEEYNASKDHLNEISKQFTKLNILS